MVIGLLDLMRIGGGTGSVGALRTDLFAALQQPLPPVAPPPRSGPAWRRRGRGGAQSTRIVEPALASPSTNGTTVAVDATDSGDTTTTTDDGH